MMPMKGLLKGLRYISQIFDNEKEEEIQIGFPTDVKHVAHIGMDGPSTNTPTWMNKYNPNSEASPALPNAELKNKPSTKSLAEEVQRSSNLPLDTPTHLYSSKTKHSRRNHSSNSSTGSGDEDSFNLNKPRQYKHSGEMGSSTSECPKQYKHSGEMSSPTSERPRRHKHSGEMGSSTSENPRRHKHSGEMGSLTSERPRRHKQSGEMGKHSGEMASPTSERPRQHKHSGDIGPQTFEQTRRVHNQNIGSHSPSDNGPKIPKSHRKKSEGSSGSGMMKSSRSKEAKPYPQTSPYSDPGPGPRFKNDKVRSNPVYEEGNEYEEISRGIRAL